MIICSGSVLCRSPDLFQVFVCVRQPDFVDVMQYVFAWLTVVLSVALQDLSVFKRVLERNERRFGILSAPYKEDERFFTYKALVIIHFPHAMVKDFSLAYEFGRRVGDNTDERASFIMFERQILFGDTGKLFVQFLFRLSVCFRLRRGILVYADIMPAFEIVRKAILLF